MLHLHWPHRWVQMLDDVEHQGELQTIGFVLVTTTLIGLLLFTSLTAIVEFFKTVL